MSKEAAKAVAKLNRQGGLMDDLRTDGTPTADKQVERMKKIISEGVVMDATNFLLDILEAAE